MSIGNNVSLSSFVWLFDIPCCCRFVYSVWPVIYYIRYICADLLRGHPQSIWGGENIITWGGGGGLKILWRRPLRSLIINVI